MTKKPFGHPKIKVRRVVETTIQRTISINGEQIILALKKVGIDVPSGATIQFVVPGGGEWSGQEIDIDDDNPVQIDWREHKMEANDE